jgi:hypothetical protein
MPRESSLASSSPAKLTTIDFPTKSTSGESTTEELERRLKAIFKSGLDESEASIRRAAENIGLCVVTQEQFKVMEWGTRQLMIHRLQDECVRILEAIKTP